MREGIFVVSWGGGLPDAVVLVPSDVWEKRPKSMVSSPCGRLLVGKLFLCISFLPIAIVYDRGLRSWPVFVGVFGERKGLHGALQPQAKIIMVI